MSDQNKRLDPSLFNLPIHEIRCGHRSAVYFWRSKRILERDHRHPKITHQIFQKQDDVLLCGTDEAIAILKCGTGYYSDYDKALSLFEQILDLDKKSSRAANAGDYKSYLDLNSEKSELSVRLHELWIDGFHEIEVQSLRDGDELAAWETAMLIEGDYALFAHLESLYLGVLARRTKVATNSRAVVQAANGKPVLFFTDRFDHFAMQDGDGYAAHLGGVSGVASDAMASWYGEKGVGTIPHAMIVAYQGDSRHACQKFHEFYPDVNTISLVDFDNDCVNTALEVARDLGDKLWGVRLDTASTLTDRSLENESGLNDDDKFGVTPLLVEKVRTALDREGFGQVKIIASGGFNPLRITRFEELQVPVDVYAVGSWILTGRFDFTADAVRLQGTNLAKVGREYKPSARLKKHL